MNLQCSYSAAFRSFTQGTLYTEINLIPKFLRRSEVHDLDIFSEKITKKNLNQPTSVHPRSIEE